MPVAGMRNCLTICYANSWMIYDYRMNDVDEILGESLVWDNHGCMPLRPGDDSFLDQLERYRRVGVDVVTLNIGFGPQTLDAHLQVLASFRRWIAANSEAYALVQSTADIDTAQLPDHVAHA